MAKVCVGCGLTTDTDGNLIAAVSGVASAFPNGCDVATGTLLYCDASDGKLYGAPEKFSKFDRVGKLFQQSNVPARITSLVSQDGVLKDISSEGLNTATSADKTPLSFTIKNPSKCLPFYVYLESGVSHANFTYHTKDDGTGDGGDFNIELSSYVTITGNVDQTFAGHTGHQIWGFDTDSNDEGIVFDTMGARATVKPVTGTKFTITPGGTMNVKANPYISLDLNGNSDVANLLNYTIDVNWWGSNDL